MKGKLVPKPLFLPRGGLQPVDFWSDLSPWNFPDWQIEFDCNHKILTLSQLSFGGF